jgi:hypothetical protein
MMFYVRCNRKEFAKFIAAKSAAILRKSIETSKIETFEVEEDEILLCWNCSPERDFILPHVVVVNENSFIDFLAWIASYFREFEPFTSQCRVLTARRAETAFQQVQANWADANQLIDIALIFAEVAAYSIGNQDRIPFSTYERSLSFAISKALRQYGEFNLTEPKLLHILEDSWTKARELAGEPPLGLDSKAVREVWGIVLQSNSDSRNIDDKENWEFSKSLRVFRREGYLDKRFLQEIPTGLDFHRAALFEIDDRSREERVLAFEEAAKGLTSSDRLPQRTRAFLLGFIASRIAPGTLQHISVLFPYADKNRECLLWFGVFAGLSVGNDISSFSQGLGWMLRRELERTSHLTERPTCDISLDEFLIFSQSTRSKRNGIRSTSNGILKIEIYPLVSTNVRWPQGQFETLDGRTYLRQGQLFADEEKWDSEIMRLLIKLEESMGPIERIRKEISRLRHKRG